MAAELPLASVYTVGTKERTVGGAEKDWIQKEWTGTYGVVQAHATLVPRGSAQVPSGGNLGESGP